VALEGSFPHIDDATRVSLPPLAASALAVGAFLELFVNMESAPHRNTNLGLTAATMNTPAAEELLKRKVLTRLRIYSLNYTDSNTRHLVLAPRRSPTSNPQTSQDTGPVRTMSGAWTTSKRYARPHQSRIYAFSGTSYMRPAY
jgi:hypothetical protein